ncbi:MAG: TetR/AcrR family transcriptional regulator [Deltaproteobacteria bacterium]|nr:TetR/AcrR family transcriptional regulator [Deltaproteobacteria bacterium]
MDPQERRRAAMASLTLPPPAKAGRGRLVSVAMTLFYHRGISPVGLDEIVAETGVTKTTFYKHFRSKTELVVAAIEARHAWQMTAWKEAVEILVGPDPRDQLQGMFDVLDLAFNEPSFQGCHFINAAAEFPNPHDPVHRAAARHKQISHQWFRELADRAGATRSSEFADAYAMLFEGVLVIRQVHARADVARAAGPHVRRLLDAFIPNGRKST